MSTDQDLIAASFDALSLTRFMTEPSGTQNLNSTGTDVGTLADGFAQMAPIFEDVTALLADTRVHTVGTLLSTARPQATYRVVEDLVAGHLVTAGGLKLWHIDGPYIIAIAGQSNAAGVWPGGPDPASPLVQTWDPATTDWGGSSQASAPWTATNPNGNQSNANYALARAHYMADQTGRPIFIIFDAAGGTAISEWTQDAPNDTRFASLNAKVNAALDNPLLSQHGISEIDEIIFAQGEANYGDGFEVFLSELQTLNAKLRGSGWFGFDKPCYMMSPTDLHDRYLWREALKYHCSYNDSACIFVPAGGLQTEYTTTGTGDNSHFLADSIWRAGYHGIANAAAVETAPALLWARGSGPAHPGDPTALTSFSSLVSRDSWTSSTPINGPAATGSMSWGGNCFADGNYTAAFGYDCATDNLANYGLIAGRSLNATSTSDYFAAFGYQNSITGKYTFASGRGHVVQDQGGSAVGMFSEHATAEADNVMFQVGIGTSTSNRRMH